ncbi:glycoside hydrolase family 2 protein [Arachidicoccus terrestris]|uniref:glycoside hydrolase family 2 protein n=1 Tax=Arachidicoccus terrestris TaxID=2875539 RepID=UPI001CC38DD2|nr:sugar-binding domain-containing protein [Arachidicoccus terrestris]UAY55743.1 glycoside hydrolase family 2 [Arachidicoccus terrestris]
MIQTKSKLWCIAMALLFSATGCKSQQLADWKMQSVVLQTRWAKDVNPDKPLNVYPRPQLERKEWQNLNGLWKYAITAKDTTIPNTFDGKILVPYPLESALSGVEKKLLPTQDLWYRRTFTVKSKKSTTRTLLHFGAVDFEATVYLNGKEVGKHQGGYQNFDIDITDALKQGDNELVVKVWDPTDQGPNPHGKQVLDPQGIMYTPTSGIWQTVWLESVPHDYIKGLKIMPDIDQSLVTITVNSDVSGPVEITTAGKTITGNANEGITVPVANPKLWSPENPYLYDLTVKMGKDEVNSYFGMRKIAIQKDDKGIDRIFLNNKPYYNLGVLDQGFWPDGLYTAPTDEALSFDIKAIKDMGFNTIRKHIKVEPERWYYYADKIGMLVWQDMVNPGNTKPDGKAEFEKECKENIAQLYNHPSITTWVLFNEKWGQYDQKRLTDELKQTDPTRIVNGHSGEYLYVNGQLRSPSPDAYVDADLTDVHSYPAPRLPMQQPDKAMVCGEFGGIGVSVPYHEWNDLKGWGYVEVLPQALITKYDSLVHILKQLQTQGLSGSIYTQPFDVEGEENGLMTYDRDMIKIPLKKIREINSLLNPLAGSYQPAGKFTIGKNIDPNDNDNRYPELLKEFENGKKDSAFLRRLTLMAMRKKDNINVTRAAIAYLKSVQSPFNEKVLDFLKQTTRTTKDFGFNFILKNIKSVNRVWGNDGAEAFLRSIIWKETITTLRKQKESSDLEKVEKETIAKYDTIGERAVWSALAGYAWEAKKVSPFVKYKDKLHAKYPQEVSNYWYVNNDAWFVFEQSNEKKELESALAWQKKVMENDPDANDYDTYANLLYKLGKKKDALEWEEKAVQLAPEDKAIQGSLEKMQQGKPTWK